MKLKYSINFRIEKRKDKKSGKTITKNVPIKMDFVYDGKRLTYFTGYRIDAEKWIESTIDSTSGEIIKVQKVRKNTVNKDGIQYNIINKYLDSLKNNIEDIYIKAKSNDIQIDNKYLCDMLTRELKEDTKITASSSNVFWNKWEEYIQTHDVSELRRKHLKSTRNHFLRFTEYSKRNISFESLTPKLLTDFEKYLYEDGYDDEKYKDLSYKHKPKPKSQNTICGILKRFRAFLNWCKLPQNGALIQENPFYQFKIKGEVYGAPICMNKKERDYLYDQEIKDKRLSRVRDIFCFQCFIGCRVGDLIELTQENIADGILTYSPNKTKEKPKLVKVPLSNKAKAILARYNLPDGKLLPFITDQRYNEYLKELFEHAGLNRIVTRLNPLTLESEQVSLSQMASSHLARRTFIHILHKNVKDSVIASMSGHTKGSKAFNRYYDVEDSEKQEAIEKYLD